MGNGGECGEGFGYDIVSERLHAPQPASGSPEEVFSPWKPGPRWDDNKGDAVPLHLSKMNNCSCFSFSIALALLPLSLELRLAPLISRCRPSRLLSLHSSFSSFTIPASISIPFSLLISVSAF